MRQNRQGTVKRVAGAATVMVMLGCGGAPEQGQMTADLERDLQLAIDARPAPAMVVSAIEGGPTGAPSGRERGRRDAVPTPRRTPRPAPAPQVEEVAAPEPQQAAAPVVTDPVATETAPAPTPEPVPQVATIEPGIHQAPERGPSAGSGEIETRGEGGMGSGRRGGGWGGIIGVIIRGGGAGIDNCEEHDRRRAGRRGGRGEGTVIAIGRGGRGGLGGRIDDVMGGVVNGGGRPTFPRY